MFKPSVPFKGPSSLRHIWSIIQNRFNHTFPFTCSNHLLHSGFCPHSRKYQTLPFRTLLQTVSWYFHSHLVTHVFHLCVSQRLTYVPSLMCMKKCVLGGMRQLQNISYWPESILSPRATRVRCIFISVHVCKCIFLTVHESVCTHADQTERISIDKHMVYLHRCLFVCVCVCVCVCAARHSQWVTLYITHRISTDELLTHANAGFSEEPFAEQGALKSDLTHIFIIAQNMSGEHGLLWWREMPRGKLWAHVCLWSDNLLLHEDGWSFHTLQGAFRRDWATLTYNNFSLQW